MKLFESAWDGDVECVKGLQEMGVPVDVAGPVRSFLCSCIQCTTCYIHCASTIIPASQQHLISGSNTELIVQHIYTL